ncbi:MAG TPA: amylo-alpha-1,6-glucosidase [Acidobacteriaceae bacterium]
MIALLTSGRNSRSTRHCATALLALAAALPGYGQASGGEPGSLPQISSDARPAELLVIPGHRSALLGHESGHFEAWAWPLKILHDFHISVRISGEVIPCDSLIRSVTIRPESTTLVCASNTFSIKETLLVPIDQPAALIQLQIQTAEPLEIIASFQPDLQLEWPAAIGGMDVDWNPRLHAYVMTEPQLRYEAVVGSPTATEYAEAYPPDYPGPRETAFSLGVTPKGTDSKTIVMTGWLGGTQEAKSAQAEPKPLESTVPTPAEAEPGPAEPREAELLYQQLTSRFDATLDQARAWYANYLKDRVQVSLPDPMLQDAFTWSEIGMIQARVDNPWLGTGLIAGYNVSGDDERPGFAWFFGRDQLWTTLALNAVGDYATSRAAIDFLARVQRRDGKIPHEISQSAALMPWFQSVPFAWASADATPLFLIATNDYVQQSGDVQFARDRWDNLWRAYQYLSSTYGPQGLAQNLNVGHGWIEAGPLTPIRAELYQSALGVEAVRSLAALAALLDKADISEKLTAEFNRQLPVLNRVFWIPDEQFDSLGLDLQNQPIRIPSVLSAVPMEFGLLDADKTETMLDRLAAPDFQTDWGMRIISSRDPHYDPGGYHNGTVWPLFTGWASMAAYRYHRPLVGYANLRTNAELTGVGSPGHVTEVLSGNYAVPSGSPAQIWSSAMVAAPLLRGLFGLEPNATTHTLTFAPHVPANWTSFSVTNVRVGAATLDLQGSKTLDAIRLEVTRRGQGSGGDQSCNLDFAPALSLQAHVRRVLLDGRPIPFHLEKNTLDQHVRMHIATKQGTETVTIELSGDFGITEMTELPLPGSPSRGVRVTAQHWAPQRDVLTLTLAGPAQASGELGVWNPSEIASVDGATLVPDEPNKAQLQFQMPQGDANGDAHLEIAIRFHGGSKAAATRKK